MSSSQGRQKATDSEIVQAMKDHPDPVVTASDLAEVLPLTRQQLNTRLDDLRDRGIAASKQSGSGQVWWIRTD